MNKHILVMNINGEQLFAQLEDNCATRELVEKLVNGDVMVRLSDFGGFEKTGPLGFKLAKVEQYMNVDAGDVVLYLRSDICIYYDKNSWNFTPLGKVTNVNKDRLKEILGSGDVSVVLSLK